VALWHDPLEELIAGLERALPAETWSEIVPYEVFCLATDVLLYGTPEEWEAFQLGPEGQRSCPHGPSALSCASCRHAGGCSPPFSRS
jgi:hypothetical protein